MSDTAITTQLADPPVESARPSSFYRAGLWRAGLNLAAGMPAGLALALGATLGAAYWLTQARRRQIVLHNLLPLFNGDVSAARRATRRLFVNFGRKLADLMRHEAGVSLKDRFVSLEHWDRFATVHARGQGVLMLTPHLGNWEIGSPLLVERRVDLLVVTQAEPGADLTELRRHARRRSGVETVVIGNDAFAFIEIIKRLQAGATVAMLIDRPPAQSAVQATLCGQPYPVSLAPAELARASGCALVGVCIVEGAKGYEATVLPEFTYDRRALGDRAARQQFMQRILSAFEPMIRKHADQWYHFVPVWPAES
jgi:KDO2-lipid IV(A) lauroyltransferase